MKELTIAGSSNDEIVQTAQQNDMSIEFVRWFFNKKKADCGEHWFLMLGGMWEGWKGRSIEMDRLAAENVALKNPDNWLSQSDFGYEAAEVATQNGANEEESLRAGMIAIINRIETPATDRIVDGIKADEEKAVLNDLLRHLDKIDIGNISSPWELSSEVVAFVNSRQLREGADK
ncbi:TPA: hypothetical protein NEF91_002919 [Klebsiella oxytoca]|nr:hypothetical protein [Klebsiella oxytoca]HCD9025527.1 hypothetical protein [Klebsiella oxytoca]